MKKFLSITNKSLDELGVVTYKGLWDRALQDGYQGLSLCIKTIFTKSAENKFHAVFSTDDEDRHGDIVHQEPDLRAFRKNPVFLDSHNYDSIVHIIGKVVGIKANKEEGLTEGDVEFFLDNPTGMLAYKGAEQGFLSATSIGFIPLAFDEKTGAIIKWELLEVSAVSVPANIDTLFAKQEKEESTEEEANDAGDDPPAQEPAPEPEPKPVQQPTEHRASVSDVIAHMAERDQRQLKFLLRCVANMASEDRMGTKRKLLRAIRGAIEG